VHSIYCSVRLAQAERHSFLHRTACSVSRKCVRNMFLALHLQETVDIHPVNSRTPHRHIERHRKPQPHGSEQGVRWMFRFKLRSDVALSFSQILKFRLQHRSPASMTPVTIIRHWVLVQEAGRDSFTLCAVTLGEAR